MEADEFNTFFDISAFFCFIGLIAALFFRIAIENFKKDGDMSEDEYFIIKWTIRLVSPIMLIVFLLGIFFPSQKTMVALLLNSQITEKNLIKTEETLKDFGEWLDSKIDKAIDKIGEKKEEEEK